MRHLEDGYCQRLVRCRNIDKDAQAISLSSRVSSALGLSADRFRICHSDVGHDVVNLYDIDVVCLAALVGENYEDKRKVVGDVVRQMRPGALLVLRTATSLKQLLYPVSCGRQPRGPLAVLTQDSHGGITRASSCWGLLHC